MSTAKDKRDAAATPLDEEFLAELAESVAPCRPEPARQAAMRERILSGIRTQAPAGTSTLRATERDWIRITPSIDVRVLRQNPEQGRQTVLYRMQPGAVFPVHGHDQDEECYVLEGEVNVGDYFLRAGDFHVARAGHVHPEIESKAGALLFIQEAQRSYVPMNPA